jgi:hypothetical protein
LKKHVSLELRTWKKVLDVWERKEQSRWQEDRKSFLCDSLRRGVMAMAATPKRPTRDEFELEDWGIQLLKAKDDGDERSLTVWGMPEKVRGRITVLDSRTRLVHVDENGTIRKIPFLGIMKVTYE